MDSKQIPNAHVDFGVFRKAMMKTEKFSVTVSEEGVSATIRKFSRIKSGKTYTTFSAEYFLLGKRKQEWRSKFEDAKAAALEACRTISRGQQVSLQLLATSNPTEQRDENLILSKTKILALSPKHGVVANSRI